MDAHWTSYFLIEPDLCSLKCNIIACSKVGATTSRNCLPGFPEHVILLLSFRFPDWKYALSRCLYERPCKPESSPFDVSVSVAFCRSECKYPRLPSLENA